MSTEILTILSDIAGNDNAFPFADDRAAPYRRLFGFIAGASPDYIAVVRPPGAEGVQAAIQAIHGAGLRLLATPNGAGNGARLEAGEGSVVILDLSRLDKILEVEHDYAYALVEPGVSYRQLYQHIRAEGLKLWIDPDRDPEHSVTGSIVSRQFGYTPYGDHLGMQCGAEVVLPDGEMLRTGMGALPGSDTWQLFKYNFGPYLDGLFTQSDLAVVTKVGLWLMPPPPRYMPFKVSLMKDADLAAAVDILRPMRISNTVPNTVAIVHSVYDAAPYTPRAELAEGGTVDPAAAARDGGLWTLYGALYDSPANVDFLWKAVEGALRSIEGVKIATGEMPGDDDPAWAERRNLMRGVPPQAPPNLSGWGGPRTMRVTFAAPLEGSDAIKMRDIAARTVEEAGRDYLGEFALTARTLLKHVHLPYDPDDAASREAVMAAAQSLIENMAGAGYGLMDESFELQYLGNQQTAGTPLADLVGRVREGLKG